jgi:hypothetical protein
VRRVNLFITGILSVASARLRSGVRDAMKER